MPTFANAQRSQEAPVRILLLARYGLNGASSRVRHYAYMPGLLGDHVSITPHWIIDDGNLERYYGGRPRSWWRIATAYAQRIKLMLNAKNYDFVWIEKEALPFIPSWVERWTLARARVPAVFDFDDLWVRRRLEARRGLIGGLELRKLRKLVRTATAVTVSNTFLAEALYKLTGRRAIVLENCIDPKPYRLAAERRSKVAALRPGKMRIGWIGTPFTARLYLPGVTELLNRLSAEGLSETVLIGAGVAIQELNAVRLPWSIEAEPDAVAGIDIGIQPLVGNEFDQCKSGWKLYQYMAAGKAVVASRVGFNSELVEDGITGFLVNDVDEFEQRLRQLLRDGDLRRAMGRRAQAVIAERYGIQRGVEERSRLFRDLVFGARFKGNVAT